MSHQPNPHPAVDFVVVANRLPVDRHVEADGTATWRRSPGGLVTAMSSVMAAHEGAWIGWAGDSDEAPEPFVHEGIHLEPVLLSAEDVREYYDGFNNDTLWPIYHDVIVPATFHRRSWNRYKSVNHRFAVAAARLAAPGATVWVHDYQLQLVPAMLRELRPDLRIGWFNHIPFPPVELFAQLPWRDEILRGLLGADFLGFQRGADARNFLRACRQLLSLPVRADRVSCRTPETSTAGADFGDHRWVRAASVPISIDFAAMDALARRPSTVARAAQIRESLGNPRVMLLGVDRLDYTKGIRHRLMAFAELLRDGAFAPPDICLVQVATPSRERVEAYREMREYIERTVGQINGDYGQLGTPAVHYLHHTYDRDEMAALYLAADVMLVTPLRDGMNLVAKEYVACRPDLGGALVLSEFTGAWYEMRQTFVCNPHDIEGLKQTIVEAIETAPRDKRRIMRQLRKRVAVNDVDRWARQFLAALECAPARPSDAAPARPDRKV